MDGIDELDALLGDLETSKPSHHGRSSSAKFVDLDELDDLVGDLEATRMSNKPRHSSNDEYRQDFNDFDFDQHDNIPSMDIPPPPPLHFDTTPVQSVKEKRRESIYVPNPPKVNHNGCARCGGELSGEYLQALDRNWHVHHFTCHKCDSKLAGAFYEHEGQPTCENCMLGAHRCNKCGQGINGQYFVLNDGAMLHPHCKNPCAKCGGVITETEIQALDRAWHSHCFVCHNCGSQLSGAFYQKNGQPTCERCGVGPKVLCLTCGDSIAGKYVSFEGKNFHHSCFRCAKCSSELSPSEFYCVNDQFQCKRCVGK